MGPRTERHVTQTGQQRGHLPARKDLRRFRRRRGGGRDPLPEPALHALVSGMETYTTEVWIEDDVVAGSCDCPNAEDGWFCKHQVAVALVWRDRLAGHATPIDASARKSVQSSVKRARTVEDKRQALHDFLHGLDASTLADKLLKAGLLAAGQDVVALRQALIDFLAALEVQAMNRPPHSARLGSPRTAVSAGERDVSLRAEVLCSEDRWVEACTLVQPPAVCRDGVLSQIARHLPADHRDLALALLLRVFSSAMRRVQQPVSGRTGAGRGDRSAHGFRSTRCVAGAAAHGVQGQAKLRSGLA